MVASRVLTNMELVEGENANRLCFLYWVTRHQVHLHHPSTKGVSGVCLSARNNKQAQKSTSTKSFREKASHSEAEQKNKENTKAHHQALSYRGFTATKPYMQDSYARWLLKESTQLLSMCWHQENAMPSPGIEPGTFRSSV